MQDTFLGVDVEVAREDLAASLIDLMLKRFEQLLNRYTFCSHDNSATNEDLPTGLNETMFIPTIEVC